MHTSEMEGLHQQKKPCTRLNLLRLRNQVQISYRGHGYILKICFFDFDDGACLQEIPLFIKKNTSKLKSC